MNTGTIDRECTLVQLIERVRPILQEQGASAEFVRNYGKKRDRATQIPTVTCGKLVRECRPLCNGRKHSVPEYTEKIQADTRK